MLPTGHKLTHVGALEVSHSHVMEVEHSSVCGVEDLSGPGLGNDLVEHDLQLAPLPFPVLAALVVQHLQARNTFIVLLCGDWEWPETDRGVQVDDDGESDVGHGQRDDQIEDEEDGHHQLLLHAHRHLHGRQEVHLSHIS